MKISPINRINEIPTLCDCIDVIVIAALIVIVSKLDVGNFECLSLWIVSLSATKHCFSSDHSKSDRENNCERESAFDPITGYALSNHAQYTCPVEC